MYMFLQERIGTPNSPHLTVKLQISPYFTMCLVSPSLGEEGGGRGGRYHCSWALSTLRFHGIQRFRVQLGGAPCWEVRRCYESGEQGSRRISVALSESSLN